MHFLGGGFLDAPALGQAYTAVAEASLRVALEITEKAFAAEHGTVPGSRLAVLAMGRLGSREMTASSDLDLIVVYDLPKGVSSSDGRRPLDPVLYFSRLTHRLITSVSTPTSHGRLYDIDMRLRPSGGKGPVALPLSAFVDYQKSEAETWEHLALTRARPVAGDAGLCRQVGAAVRRVLARKRDAAKVARDVKAMRKLLASEKGDDDVADLKNMRGGLVAIDFCAQFLILAHAARHPSLHRVRRSTRPSRQAAAQGLIARADADRLVARAHALLGAPAARAPALDRSQAGQLERGLDHPRHRPPSPASARAPRSSARSRPGAPRWRRSTSAWCKGSRSDRAYRRITGLSDLRRLCNFFANCVLFSGGRARRERA